MTLEQLRRAKDARPFEAFEICTADGQRIGVDHPEFLFVPPTAQRTFVVAYEDGTCQVMDLLRVSTLNFRNGRGRKARRR